MTTHRILGWLVATLSSSAVYAVLFLYLLGLKVLRHVAEIQAQETWLVTEVTLGTLAFVLTLEALVLIFCDRTLSGRFFYFSVIAGACLVLWSTACLLGPVEVAIGLGHYAWKGLAVGCFVLIVSNILCFFFKIPSLL